MEFFIWFRGEALGQLMCAFYWYCENNNFILITTRLIEMHMRVISLSIILQHTNNFFIQKNILKVPITA